MATISKIQGAFDLRLTAQEAEKASTKPNAAQRAEQVEIAPSTIVNPEEKTASEAAQSLDPKHIRDIAARLQDTIDKVARDPHEVAFHQDPATDLFVIEIKSPDGIVIKQYPPEKVLNLMRKLDDLSGMVVDEMT